MDNNGKTGSDIEGTRCYSIIVYRCRALVRTLTGIGMDGVIGGGGGGAVTRGG